MLHLVRTSVLGGPNAQAAHAVVIEMIRTFKVANGRAVVLSTAATTAYHPGGAAGKPSCRAPG